MMYPDRHEHKLSISIGVSVKKYLFKNKIRQKEHWEK